MRLCISSLAWSNNDRIEVYELLQKNKIKYLEIVLSKLSSKGLNEDPELYLKYKEEWERFGLQAISMQSIHFGIEEAQLFGTDQERENLLNATKKALDIGVLLGVKNFVFGSPKLRIIPQSCPEYYSIAQQFFSTLNNYAYEKKCFLNLEPNSKEYGTNFLTDTLSVVNFLQDEWHNIGINLDLSTMILEQESISKIIGLMPKINHAHISVPFLQWNFNEYQCQIREYISSLKDETVISIEIASQKTDLDQLQQVINLIKREI